MQGDQVMPTTLYKQNGKALGYLVTIKRKNIAVAQEYFWFSFYRTWAQCQKAALKRDRELRELWTVSDVDKMIAPDGRVYGILLLEDRHNNPSIRLISNHNKKRLIKSWSIGKHGWETAYEEAVKLLLQHKQISLTPGLAQALDKAKKKYNPSRKSNWLPRVSKPGRPVHE